MQGNFFQGTIPSSLRSLRGIEDLSLSRNNFSGRIPEFLEEFKFLESLDLSYRNFEGMVPIKGVFRNSTATSVRGNSKLCGGIPEFRLPNCKLQHANKIRLSLTMKFVISLVSYQSVLKASEGFSLANLIGKGSFGSVYKGVIENSETTIAIKVRNLLHPAASKSFFVECEALKNIRHRNLVKVLSACSGYDHRSDDFKVLIYVFMVNVGA
ncbi:PREDICTED: probable LRR receptor [Prunus dulcis]|uniref:PREDICTED: probable LRR receptor n=1 Tax=Prunus dulcis TaxID=3755 RepID=A0A5E4FNS1_PRUDU|nr:PREDICTED: probable LRR receptor [Prunus dulcis]